MDILDSANPADSDVSATQEFFEPPELSIITTYLPALDFDGIRLSSRGPPYECVIFHALMHACVDHPALRDITSGAIRHALAICGAISRLHGDE